MIYKHQISEGAMKLLSEILIKLIKIRYLPFIFTVSLVHKRPFNTSTLIF